MTLNAVLSREIKERMRSPRATVMMVLFIGILSGILYLAYYSGAFMLENQGFGGRGGASSAALGRMMFEWLLLFLLIFVMFMTPGIAASGIVGERERRTLHLLQVTMLSPRSIVLGKVWAALAYIGLLVLATAPLFTIPLVLGGVTLWQVAKGLMVIGVTMVFLAALSTYVSAIARRLQFAIVMAYGAAMFLIVGTLIMFVLEGLGNQFAGGLQARPLSPYLNPVAAVSSAITERRTTVDLPVPLTALGGAILEMERNPVFGLGDTTAVEVVGAEGQVFEVVGEPAIMPLPAPAPVEGFDGPVPFGARGGEPVFGPAFADHELRRDPPALRLWIVYILIMTGLSALTVFLAAHRLRTPAPKFVTARRDKSGW